MGSWTHPITHEKIKQAREKTAVVVPSCKESGNTHDLATMRPLTAPAVPSGTTAENGARTDAQNGPPDEVGASATSAVVLKITRVLLPS